MRIVSADIDSFGGTHKRLFKTLDSSVVCVSGPNEIGKSTFYSFLVTMLFGLPSRRADRKALMPSDGRALEGRLKYRLSDGSEHLVSRRAAQKIDGTVNTGEGLFGRETVLGNDPVPSVNGVSRAVYEALYALTLSEMRTLDSKTFGEVREVLLGVLNFDHVRPVHAVVSELEREAAALWRPDNRGKPEASRVVSQIDQCRGRLEEARSVGRELAALRASYPLAENRLASSQAQLQVQGVKIEEMQHLQGLAVDIQRHRNLVELSAIIEGYDDLPDVVNSELVILHKKLDADVSALAEQQSRLATLEETVVSFGHQQQLLVSRAANIRAMANEVSDYRRSVASVLKCHTALATSNAAYNELSVTLFAEAELGVPEFGVEELDALELATANRDGSSSELLASLREVESLQIYRSDSRRLFALALLCVLIAAVSIGLSLSEFIAVYSDVLFFGGVLACLAGIAISLLGFGRRSRYEQAVFALDLGGRRRTHKRRIDEVRFQAGCLNLGVDSDQDGDGAPMKKTILELRELLEIREDRRGLELALRDAQCSVTSFDKRLETIVEGLSYSDGPSDEIAFGLSAQLQDALAMQVRATDAEANAKRARVSGAKLAKELEASKNSILEIETRLLDLAKKAVSGDKRILAGFVATRSIEAGERERPSSQVPFANIEGASSGSELVEIGLKVLERGRSARTKSVLLESSLSDRYSDADRARLAELQVDERSMDEQIRAARRRITELQREVSDLTTLVEQQKARAEQLATLKAAPEIELELADLRSELIALKHRRDRLTLLRNVITVAEKQFRENHEPDVLARAGKYLAQITDGAWIRLRMPENGELAVVDQNGRTQVVREPMSRGTLDQIFLSLRLGIVDHLDRSTERLPLFLDELFVNWDKERRARMYPIIRGIAEHRQVFFFTCHEWMREELAVHLGAQVIDLDQLADEPERQQGQIDLSRSQV